MLVKSHILLFMLKGQHYPHAFPFLLLLLLLHTSHILITDQQNVNDKHMITAMLRTEWKILLDGGNVSRACSRALLAVRREETAWPLDSIGNKTQSVNIIRPLKVV